MWLCKIGGYFSVESGPVSIQFLQRNMGWIDAWNRRCGDYCVEPWGQDISARE